MNPRLQPEAGAHAPGKRGLRKGSLTKAAEGRPELTASGFQVLVALAAGATHGYAVMRFVDQLTDGQAQMPAGTLYRTMARLLADGLVDEVNEADPTAPHDARRRYYRLTDRGRALAAAEGKRLVRLVGIARQAGLLDSGEPA
jgi:DNA-binding PadR family transcriptional regulator